eukprot:5172409-Pyramimonas_sp.AAC.1
MILYLDCLQVHSFYNHSHEGPARLQKVSDLVSGTSGSVPGGQPSSIHSSDSHGVRCGEGAPRNHPQDTGEFTRTR